MLRPPLAGYRVLDLSRILAGPFCTMMLADLGAEVIKIEHIRNGDDTRSWGPPFTSDASRQSAYFLGVNRNKKSVAVDLKHPKGIQIIRELAAKSDVVVENFVPGKAAELGFGYEALSRINPKLVYGSISGYGESGPRSQQLAYDVMISAVGGLMGITGPSSSSDDGATEAEVCKVGVAITDVCSGLALQGAILGALLARNRDGVGQRIATSLLDTQIACLANVASAYLVGGVVTKPMGTAHHSIVPYQRFACRDGQSIIVGALNDGQFGRLCAALDYAPRDVALHDKYRRNQDRVANREELIALLEATFRGKDACEWLAKLESCDVPCAPINRVDQVFSDAQVAHNRRVMQVLHPTVGMLKLVAPPVTFYGTALATEESGLLRPPPLLGEHTVEVLRDVLGKSRETIQELEEVDRAVRSWRGEILPSFSS